MGLQDGSVQVQAAPDGQTPEVPGNIVGMAGLLWEGKEDKREVQVPQHT